MEEVKGKMEDCHTDSELLTQFHKNIPQLRFCGFDDGWEESAFYDCFSLLKNNTLSRDELSYTEGSIKNVHYGDVLIKFPEILDVSNNVLPCICNSKKSTNCFLKNGDIVMADTAEDETAGKCTEIYNCFGEIVSGLHTIPLRPKFSFASLYLGFYLNSTLFHNQLLPLMQGTKVTSISKNALTRIQVRFPEKKLEQQKIGTFLSHVDSLIQAKTKKLESLKAVKKSLLQKCFPKAGEKVPEMRFAGFSGDWEEKKLGEIANIYDGTHQTPKYQSTGVKFLSVENIKNLETDKYISTADFVKDFKIYPQKGDILMTRIGDIGTTNIYLSTEPIAFYVSLALLKPTNIDSMFLNYVIQSPFVQNELSLHTLHTAIPKKINKNEISLVKLLVPSSKSEQQKIGHFFSKYDSLISAQQKEIDKLKDIKKSLLQKMFI